MTVVALYISAGHNYFGHHEKPPGEHPMQRVAEIECVAGRGIRGDRFFDFKADYKGQITFFASEMHEELAAQLGIPDRDPGVFRRNVITRGVRLEELIGVEFEIQGVRFAGVCECSPCYWMNTAFGPGTESALRDRGGLRARILTDGILRTS
jgi:MOSC domain-containing protein YiiM